MALDRRVRSLSDAILALDDAVAFVGDRTFERFRDDPVLCAAVERKFEILGEACVRLGQADPSLMTRVPHARLAIGMRNRIIHRYDNVDSRIVFQTVRDDLPQLRAELQRWLDELGH